MLKDKTLLDVAGVSKLLNMTEEEILYLVRTRGIPHRVESGGRLTFTKWEVTARIIAAPHKDAMPKMEIDVSKMTKDEIMQVFSRILQDKAAEETQAVDTEEEDEEEDEPTETVRPEPRNEEVPTVDPEPKKKKAPAKPKKTAAKPKK